MSHGPVFWCGSWALKEEMIVLKTSNRFFVCGSRMWENASDCTGEGDQALPLVTRSFSSFSLRSSRCSSLFSLTTRAFSALCGSRRASRFRLSFSVFPADSLALRRLSVVWTRSLQHRGKYVFCRSHLFINCYWLAGIKESRCRRSHLNSFSTSGSDSIASGCRYPSWSRRFLKLTNFLSALLFMAVMWHNQGAKLAPGICW